jgi:NDP-sugar pyrophosphorylase family protein
LLGQHGFNNIISNLYYHADNIYNYFLDGSKYEADMLYSREDELMGTAGGVKKCSWFLDETFVIVSGDALTDVNLTRLVDEHKKRGALATIALKEVEKVEQFGVVITDESGRIHSFQEKPRKEEALSNQANTGIYIFEPEVFKYIPEREFYDFGKQVFPHLVKIGAPFFGIKIDNYWCDVGSIDTYRKSHADILEGKVNVATEGKLITCGNGRVLVGEGVYISDSVKFEGSCVIGSGCRIGDNAVIADSVIWDNSIIKENTRLQGCIIGSHCHIGCTAEVNSGAVIASGYKLNDDVKVPAAVKIY